MGVYLDIVDLDKVYRESSGRTPVVINDLPAFSEEDSQNLNNLIYTTFSGDLLSNIPSCGCGKTTGNYNLDVICQSCQTPVQSVLDEDLQPLTWIRAPRGVDALINPMIWTMLRNHFTVGGFNVIQWLCDGNYRPSDNVPPVIDVISSLTVNGQQIERSYNFFIRNFDAIMAELFQMRAFSAKKEESNVLQRLLIEKRDRIFCQHLPIPHRSILVVEKNNLGTYVDPITTGAINAIRTLAGIDTELHSYNVRTKENRTVRVIDMLADFYESTYKETLAKKKGVLRKHVYATRSHFSFRAVISSITDAHKYDDIYIPWGVATSVLRIHVMNKLLRMGYTPNEGFLFINEHATKYHPLLDQIFKELIAEAPSGRGICCTLNRNPSLQRGSIQRVYISKVKTDPQIPTVSISILVVRSLNADFDGDALNLSLAVDQTIERQLEFLAPHMSSFSLKGPREVSDSMAMPKPVVATISNWLGDRDEPVDPAKREIMKSLAMA